MAPPPHNRQVVVGLGNEYLSPPRESESHARTGLLPLPHVGGTYLLEHQPLPQLHGFADGPAVPLVDTLHESTSWQKAAPMTEGGFSAVDSSFRHTCTDAHSACQPQLPSQQLTCSHAVGSNGAWSTHPVQSFAVAGGGRDALSFSGSGPYMARAGAAPPSTMFPISKSYRSVCLSHVDGTSSVSSGTLAPLTVPSVAVCAGGAQEVFWRRACLRVTCVPVTGALGGYGTEAAKASGDVQRTAALEEISDGIRHSDCSSSHGTRSASGEELGGLVLRWLDALGMGDAVEDVIFPGASRVIVLWTADVTHDEGITGGCAGGDAWKSSTAGERLARLLGIRGGNGEDRNSAVPGAPCEVVFGAMRLLLD
ncbi:hypothetical protein GH5_03489 [Leishmania sp. Ghana 2012 LV757]|uniref:hypothetical protein n=1 Tax=Leishmania sp. Ghana 2012 LV757 TaxID=2803181 RepID=UPI001B6DCA59|nr:hypothetical protein GH5_03489 [Leishmania sp. Ghana 2012 LV757]